MSRHAEPDPRPPAGRAGLASLCLVLAGCVAPQSDPGVQAAPPPTADTSSYVVMVSFDGMRYDLFGATAPNFRRVADAGVRSTGLIPGYPSKTFPNHYGIATGRYPAHHGLVDNTFYDPAFDAVYSIPDRSAVRDGRWYRSEPIWVTAEEQGVRTASYFWVGTEAPVQGVQPSRFEYYDESVPYSARVDSVLHWLGLPPAQRPRLVLLYFDEPDATAHDLGPDHPAVDSVVAVLDTHLGRLLDGIDALPIGRRTTVVLVSDHGMARVPEDHVVHLEDHADLDGLRVIYNSTQALLYFDGDTARIDRVHRSLRDGLEHATVYRRGQTPARWHYDDGRRIGELIVAADPGWILRPRNWSAWRAGGMHGWDPYFRPMHGIFMAVGPRIRQDIEIAAFENVHVYPFLARLLGLEPADNIDGDPDVLAPVFRSEATP